MTSDATRHRREEIGAYVLGHLSPEDRAALEAHLQGCGECRAEVRELSAVAALLPAGDPGWVKSSVAPPARLEDDVVRAVQNDRPQVTHAGPDVRVLTPRPLARRGFVRRVLVGVAAAAVSVAAVALYATMRSESPSVEAITFQTKPPGVVASAHLSAVGQAIQVHLQVRHLPPGGYRMEVTASDGRTLSTNEFRTGAKGNWSGMRQLPVSRAEAVVLTVRQVEGTAQLVANLPPVHS